METEQLLHRARGVWREILAPRLNRRGLEALFEALLGNSPLVLHGHDELTWPPDALGFEPVACEPFLYAVWKGNPGKTASDLRRCWQKLQRDNESEFGYFTFWYDNTPRKEAFLCLAAWVKESIREAGDG